MSSNKLTNGPLYQPCWNSYLGSLSGILKAMGKEEHDLINVGGFTGYAFALPNVLKDIPCPSGPTSLGKMWELILEGTDALGFESQLYEDEGCFPSQENIVSPEDRLRVEKLFQVVKKSIDKNEAVILWGVPVPEYGIVTGYQDTRYEASTFRRLINQPEDLVAYDSLQSPGSLHAITITKNKSDLDTQNVKITLKRALTLSNGDLTEKGYIAGVKAYEEWANILENAPADKSFYHGNSYVGECTLEAKVIACEFLKRLTENYPVGESANSLLAASREFGNVFELLKSFTQLFPFAFQGEVATEKRSEGASLIRRCIPYEKRALMFMKSAYDSLN